MKLYIGVTDNDWFKHLARLQPDEINFWQPGGHARFGVLAPAEPFLFKLHSPYDYIVGGGSFVRQVFLPLSLAWETFGEKNGAPDYDTFRAQILRRRGEADSPGHDPTIGCIILAAPFFFDQPDWIPVPPDWHKSIQQGKSYDMQQGAGAALWDQVLQRLQAQKAISLEPTLPTSHVPADTVRFGQYLTRKRLGQGAFRALVTEAYQHRCAITGERTLPVLQAAHIKPPPRSGPNVTSNGLLLRADLHILFDQGLLTVTPDLRVEVSRRIREEYENGRDYYALRGRPGAAARPSDHGSGKGMCRTLSSSTCKRGSTALSVWPTQRRARPARTSSPTGRPARFG